jgi:hypothetical protein
MEQVRRLAAVIELVLEYHPKGLRVLVGETEPTTAELGEILRCVCGYGNDLPARIAAAFPSSPQERALMRVDTLLNIVAEGGGWAGIAMMAREFRELYSETWKIFSLHVEWIDTGGSSRLERDTALLRLSTRFNISVDTVQRKRRFVVDKIAAAAIRTDRVLTA